MSATYAEAPPRVYRHPNGGGAKVYPAQGSPDSYIDRESSVEGESAVYAGTLLETAVKDSFVAYSTLARALVYDSRLSDAKVENAHVESSHLVNAIVRNSRLHNCRVASAGLGTPVVFGVNLSGVTVYGGATLTGPWSLHLEGAHIHAGDWYDRPRHLLIEGGGIHEAVVECTQGRAHMGCKCMPVSYWLGEQGERIAKRFGWSEEQREQCRQFLLSL